MNKILLASIIVGIAAMMMGSILPVAEASNGSVKSLYPPKNKGLTSEIGIIEGNDGNTYVFKISTDNDSSEFNIGDLVSFEIDKGIQVTNVNVFCGLTNPNLAVSSENGVTSNTFGGPMVTEVKICDSDIADTSTAKGEPDVTVNGRILRMVQAVDGNWYGYFADKTQAQLADQGAISGGLGTGLDFGYFCSNQSPVPINFVSPATPPFGDTAAVALPVTTTVSGTQGTAPLIICSGVATSTNHNNVITAFPTLNTLLSSIGQIEIIDTQLWPFVQLYNFVEEQPVIVQYNKGGTSQITSLTFDSTPTTTIPDELISAFRTISDAILVMDTDEGTKKSLTAKVNKASELVDEEKFRPAINVMNSFLKQVDALSGKKIETPYAEKLTEQGEKVVNILKGHVPTSAGTNVPGDNITVSKGETLTVEKGETLTGNIKVDGGTLIINQGTVDGNIKVSNNGDLMINQGTVTGNIKINDSALGIEKSDIRRGIKVDNSSLRIDSTNVGGDIEVKNSNARAHVGMSKFILYVKNSSIQMTGGIIGGIDIQNSSVSIEDVSVGEDGELTIKAKKVAKFKAGAALASTVK